LNPAANPTPNSTALAPISTLCLQIGVWCAALSLLSAPFRSSATLRAALFIIAALLLVLASLRERRALLHIPQGRLLRLSVATWIVFVFLHSLFVSPELRDSISSWRGDVVTPTLAAIITYSLIREGGKLAPMLCALAISMFILGVMALLDPARPGIGGHEPAYVNVGWLSTWAVSVAALLPLAWRYAASADKHSAVIRIVTVVVAVAILIAVWQSGNRISWLCLGGMFAIAVLMLQGDQRQHGRLTIVLVAIVIGVSATVFFAASEIRARQFPAAQVDGVSILQQDDRQEIWRAALHTVAEKPVLGYGFRTASATDALVAQYTTPGFAAVFRHAHNLVLNYAIQLGVPGAVIALLLFFSLAHAFWTRRLGPSGVRVAATCGLMLVFGVLLRNMTDDFFGRHAILLFGALLGMLLALSQHESSQSVKT
jgi:O-antigen ligase